MVVLGDDLLAFEGAMYRDDRMHRIHPDGTVTVLMLPVAPEGMSYLLHAAMVVDGRLLLRRALSNVHHDGDLTQINTVGYEAGWLDPDTGAWEALPATPHRINQWLAPTSDGRVLFEVWHQDAPNLLGRLDPLTGDVEVSGSWCVGPFEGPRWVQGDLALSLYADEVTPLSVASRRLSPRWRRRAPR